MALYTHPLIHYLHQLVISIHCGNGVRLVLLFCSVLRGAFIVVDGVLSDKRSTREVFHALLLQEAVAILFPIPRVPFQLVLVHLKLSFQSFSRHALFKLVLKLTRL